MVGENPDGALRPETHSGRICEKPGPRWTGLPLGVTDGTRTRDSQDHNLVLYQLNYGHHRR